MITLYWALEYSKMLFAYMFLMFIWPSVVFAGILKGKSKTFRFGFCVTMQVVLVNSAVLLLGLVHLLNAWVIRILFYGVFLWSVSRHIKIREKQKQDFKHLVMGTYGRKSYIADRIRGLGRGIGYVFRRFCGFMKGHWWDYGLLFVILVYGMIYFTYGAFQDYSYGFGDMYPHSAWIYGLTQGKVFSAGIYPEAMHCFAYSLHTLFGIRIYSCMLFLAGIHVVVYLLSAYVFMKEIFRFRYTPLFVLTAFLTVDLMCIDQVYSMSRLQWSLPQEFGLYTLFLCGAFLIRYSRSRKQIPEIYLKPFTRIKEYYNHQERLKIAARIPELSLEEEVKEPKLTKGYWDENLFVFMMALAASLAIHFYPTIMAFFVCVAILPTLAFRIFQKERLIPLITAVAAGFSIAVIPMAGGLISGIPFQGSIGWAVNVINGTDEESSSNIILDEETGEEITGNLFSWGSGTANTTEGGNGATGSGEEDISEKTLQEGQVQKKPVEEEPVVAEKKPLPQRIREFFQRKADALYYAGYVTLYRSQRAYWIVNCTFLAFALWAAVKIVLLVTGIIIKARKGKWADKTAVSVWDTGYFDGYFSITLASVFFMILYCAGSLGLPSLIAGSRICSSAQMLILAMLAVPVDLFFSLAQIIIYNGLLGAVSAIGIAGIYAGTIMTGTFHGYLYYELTRYNGAVMTTYSIISSMPEESYTIVSPTDEIYQVIQYGWHEELTDFMNSTRRTDYEIPTEHVFIYVEKKPIEYAQSHFFAGPDWLAWEKYADYYVNFVSQCPDISASQISTAEADLMRFADSSDTYQNLAVRTILESQVYRWCQKFSAIYPRELRVYYEDDDFICYYFRQNPENLYQLGIW